MHTPPGTFGPHLERWLEALEAARFLKATQMLHKKEQCDSHVAMWRAYRFFATGED